VTQIQASSARLVTGSLVAYALALALWAGGLVVLGAVVAPTVFGIVPAPTSADAMIVVFRRFDRIAMTCGALTLVAEAVLAWRGGTRTRADLARAALAFLAATFASVGGLWLSPAIEALHRGGAVRGFGPTGLELERLHRIVESLAKTELALLAVVLGLVIVRARRSG
jgi:hypothetical protein